MGLEGGSRFAGANRFALKSLEKRGICWQSPTLITSGRGAPLKAQVPDARQARYSVATLLTASTKNKALNSKGIQGFFVFTFDELFSSRSTLRSTR